MQINVVASSSRAQALGSVVSTAVDSATNTGSVPTEQQSTSGPSKLFAKLEALSKSDPAKFKEVTAQLAKTVQAAADQASDPREKQMLGDLAKKFSDASQTGDASGLKPPEGKGRHGGGGGGGGTKVFAAADTNQDGVVSPAEAAAYEARQQSKASRAYSHTQDQARQDKGKALFTQLQQIVDAA